MIKVTDRGTVYLDEPEVVLISKPYSNIQSIDMSYFLTRLQPEFGDYLNDERENLTDAEYISKFAGQLDYQSFGELRTPNSKAHDYFDRIKSESHGSVLEHANFGFLCYGISRSCSHEIVRHRAGFSYSQVSQRYVTRVRFVERPEYRLSTKLHAAFISRIDSIRDQYESMQNLVADIYPRLPIEPLTEFRKRVRQTARSILPNETETQILITANVRAWRHFLEMRASPHAETEIRELAMNLYYKLLVEAPILFSDYKVVTLQDGTRALETDMRKV